MTGLGSFRSIMASAEEQLDKLRSHIQNELYSIIGNFPGHLELIVTKTSELLSDIDENCRTLSARITAGRALSASSARDNPSQITVAEADAIDSALGFLNQPQRKKRLLRPKSTQAYSQTDHGDEARPENENGQCGQTQTSDLPLTTNSGHSQADEAENVVEQHFRERSSNGNEGAETPVTARHGDRHGEGRTSESPEQGPSNQPRRIVLRDKEDQRTRHSTRSDSTPNALPKKGKRAGPSSTESPLKKSRQAVTASDVTFRRKEIVPFFRTSTPIPKDFHQPTEIYDIFSDRSPNDDPGTIWLLTRLFFAIGSPTAFEQLRETCNVLRRHRNLPGFQPAADLRQIVGALDRLDVYVSAASVLRRLHLVSLKSHRKSLELQEQASVPSRTRNLTKRLRTEDNTQLESTSVYSRADSRALTKMMEEAYPDKEPPRSVNTINRTEYSKRLSALKERLRCERNWETMQASFAPTILLLVPIGEEYKIRDSDVERLSVPMFRVFIDVLKERRGQFLDSVCSSMSQIIPALLNGGDPGVKFRFEGMESAALKGESQDSDRLIELCEIDASESSPVPQVLN